MQTLLGAKQVMETTEVLRRVIILEKLGTRICESSHHSDSPGHVKHEISICHIIYIFKRSWEFWFFR
jgi:hypothetical protein